MSIYTHVYRRWMLNVLTTHVHSLQSHAHMNRRGLSNNNNTNINENQEFKQRNSRKVQWNFKTISFAFCVYFILTKISGGKRSKAKTQEVENKSLKAMKFFKKKTLLLIYFTFTSLLAFLCRLWKKKLKFFKSTSLEL